MGQLSPEAITQKALDAADQPVGPAGEKAIATGAHFTFGAAAGAAFGLVGSAEDLAMATAKGAVFGVALYALSYAGWIPALDILPTPTEDRGDRQLSMLAAHVLYGAALGAVLRIL